MNTESNPPRNESESLADLVVDLNFVPAWAREDAKEALPKEGGRDRLPAEEGEARRPGRGRSFPRSRETGEKMGRRGQRETRESEGARKTEAGLADLPIRVRFIPERAALGTVARDLHVSRRAMPLQRLALLFLNGENSCSVVVELRPPASPNAQTINQLYECRACHQIFREYSGVFAHVVGAHLDLHFRREVREGEPPSGQFVCVGRCRLSGELLGPPNHHAYNDRLMDLYRRRFSHLSLDEYRQQIEMVREPEVIEQWRQEARKQEVFFAKDEKDGSGELGRREAERIFAVKYAKSLVKEAHRAIIPRKVALALEDSVLARTIRLYVHREMEKPFSMMTALRAALRHMRFHTFRARGQTFVTWIEPRPLDPTHAVQEVAEVLAFLQRHPGSTRHDVVAQLRPGALPESPEVLALMRHLSWLIEKGHVIEFYNGTLAIPQALNHRRDARRY